MLVFLYGNYSGDTHQKHLKKNQKYTDCYVAYDDKTAEYKRIADKLKKSIEPDEKIENLLKFI